MLEIPISSAQAQRPQRCLFLIHSLAEAGSSTRSAWEKADFLASNRIQLQPARKAAEAFGIETYATNLRTENINAIINLPKSDICIFGKLSHPTMKYAMSIAAANLAAIPLLKSKGTKIVVTYSDNLASSEPGPISALYKSLLWHADSVVYPSRAMVKHGRPWYCHGSGPAEWIIEDPWQVNRAPFTPLIKGRCCRIIWFGHTANSSYLLKSLKSIFEQTRGWECFELTILSDAATAHRAEAILSQSKTLVPWKIRLREWVTEMQPKQLEAELQRAHICIIPSDPTDNRKSGASHNRAVDSIQSGCMTIASPLPSYQELNRVLLLSDDLSKTISLGISQYQRLIDKWVMLRTKELEVFSPSANTLKWQELFRHYCPI